MIGVKLIKSFGFASLILLSFSTAYAQQDRVELPESILEYAYQQVSPLDVGSYDDFVRQFVVLAQDEISGSDRQWLLQQLRQPLDVGVQRKFHAVLSQYAKNKGIVANDWDLPFFDKGFLKRMLSPSDSELYRSNIVEQFSGSENIVVASMRSELQQRFIYITLKDVTQMLNEHGIDYVFDNIQHWLVNTSIENQIIRNQDLSRAQLLAMRNLLQRAQSFQSIAAN